MGAVTKPSSPRMDDAAAGDDPPAWKQSRTTADGRLTLPSAVGKYVVPQWARTAVAVLVWLGLTQLYVALVAPFIVYSSARSMTVGLAISTGIFVHLWPTRTSPWRTVAWTALLTAFLGSTFLTLGLGRLALSLTTVAGFGFVLLRVNQNGRKLWDMFQTWRVLR